MFGNNTSAPSINYINHVTDPAI